MWMILFFLVVLYMAFITTHENGTCVSSAKNNYIEPAQKIIEDENDDFVSKAEILRGKYTWDDYIGNGWHKEEGRNLTNAFKAGTIDRIPHILLVGNGGVGKSHFAKVMAAESGVKFYEFTSDNVSDLTEFVNSIQDINDNDIILIDEIHNIDKKFAENYLYTILQDDYLLVPGLGKKQFPKVTFIGCTTNPELLPTSFKDRFKTTIHIENYEPEDLAKIVERVYNMDKDTSEIIAKRSSGTPRVAKSFAEGLVVYSKGRGKEINSDTAIEMFKRRKIDEKGLSPAHRKAVIALNNCKNKAMGVQSLSSTIRVSRAFFQSDVEPALFYNGLISVSSKGRELTNKGLEYVNQILKGR